MSLVWKLLVSMLGSGLIYTLVPLLIKNYHKWLPLKKGRKGNKLDFSGTKEGWYGVRPTRWDVVLAIFMLTSGIAGVMLAIWAAWAVKRNILYLLFYPHGDWVVTNDSGLKTLPVLFTGLMYGFGVGGFLTDELVKLITRVTGKTVKQIIPALYNQSSERLGIDERKFYIWVFGVVGGGCLLLTIAGSMGGYTRFTDIGIIQRGWPGLTENKYNYDQITNIWQVTSFQNRLTQQVEKASEMYYVVVFNDGREWTTLNSLYEGSLQSYSRTGEIVTPDYIIKFLTDKSGIKPVKGIKNIDVR